MAERNAASPAERLLDDCLRVLANPTQNMDERQEVIATRHLRDISDSLYCKDATL